MFISKVISFNSSWELLKSKVDAFDDIQTTISFLNETTLRDPEIVKPLNSETRPPITPLSLVRAWDTLMKKSEWGSYRVHSDIPGGINVYLRNLKDGVATKFLTTDRMLSFPNWVLVESQRSVNTEYCDVSVLVVPMESEKSIYDDPRRMGPHFFFERALAQLKDLLPLSQNEPFLVIGISSDQQPLEVIEFFSGDDENQIHRVLEFPKEHYQAGVGILSYFGEIIKKKYPDIDAKVRIEQDGNIVRMIVNTPDGVKDIIEKTLDDYALVITNQASPESLLDDKLAIHALTNKLSLAELEVKQTRDLIQISEKYADDKIRSLEDDVKFLRQHVGQQIHHMHGSQELISYQSKKEEKLLLTHLNNSQRTISDLIKDSSNRTELKDALIGVNRIIDNFDQYRDEEKAKEMLTVIRDTSPETFDDLSEALKGTMYGVSGNIVFQWLQGVASLVA